MQPSLHKLYYLMYQNVKTFKHEADKILGQQMKAKHSKT